MLLTCAHDERVINKRKGGLVARYMLQTAPRSKLQCPNEVEICNVICQQKDLTLPINSIIIHFYLQIASLGP